MSNAREIRQMMLPAVAALLGGLWYGVCAMIISEGRPSSLSEMIPSETFPGYAGCAVALSIVATGLAARAGALGVIYLVPAFFLAFDGPTNFGGMAHFWLSFDSMAVVAVAGMIAQPSPDANGVIIRVVIAAPIIGFCLGVSKVLPAFFFAKRTFIAANTASLWRLEGSGEVTGNLVVTVLAGTMLCGLTALGIAATESTVAGAQGQQLRRPPETV